MSDRCEACGLHWTHHPGIMLTCAENARLRSAQRWIPVEERLPAPQRPVLVYCEDLDRIDVGCYFVGTSTPSRFIGTYSWLNPISHWMELPEAPQ